jgi:hypothetical protein
MRSTPLLACLIAATLPTAASDEGLKRCRAIAESSARLACYDALPLGAPPAAAPRPSASSPAAPARATAAPSVSPAAPPTLAAPPTRQAQESSFGLEHRAAAAELGAVESYIPGAFGGWSQYTQIQLANGQLWQVIDEGTRRMSLQDPKVRVRRGALGAFYLEFEAHNHAPRVRRVQ